MQIFKIFYAVEIFLMDDNLLCKAAKEMQDDIASTPSIEAIEGVEAPMSFYLFMVRAS